MADLASKLVAYARSQWPQWRAMEGGLTARGVPEDDALECVDHLRSLAHKNAPDVDWEDAEGLVRAILAPQPEPPAPGEGWTPIPERPGAIKVHVSSSVGSDSGDGSSLHPLRTMAAARAREPDWIILKRGDTFPSLERWVTDGKGPDAPAVLTAYGSGPRPRFGGLIAQPQDSFHHVYLMGIDFLDEGLRWHSRGQNILVEDCRIVGGSGGLVIQEINGTLDDVRILRSLVLDQASATGAVQGAFIRTSGRTTIRQCLFDGNGQPADHFRQSLYLVQLPGAVHVVEDSIFTNGPHCAIQARCGGTIARNYVSGHAIGIQVGDGDAPFVPGGIGAEVHDNLVMDSRAMPPGPAGGERGWGFILYGTINRARVTGNTAIRQSQHALIVDPDWRVEDRATVPGLVGIKDAEISGNNWVGNVRVDGNATELAGVKLLDSEVSPDALVDPVRKLSDADLAEMRKGWTPAWAEKLAHVRAGYERRHP